MKRFKTTEKFYSSKALLNMAGGGHASPPGSAPAHNKQHSLDLGVVSASYPYIDEQP